MNRLYEVIVSIIVEADSALEAFDEVQLTLDAASLPRVSEYEIRWPILLEDLG